MLACLQLQSQQHHSKPMKEVVEEATGNALLVEKVVCHPLPKTVVFLEALFGLESHLTTADTVLVSTLVCF